jgi:hypothetical protein
MSQVCFRICMGIVLCLFVSNLIAQQKIEGIPLNQEITKEIPAQSTDRVTNQGLNMTVFCVDTTFDLTAGNPVNIDVKVFGKDRTVGIILLDPAGSKVDQALLKADSNTLSIPQVGATGKYTAKIYSSHMGLFKLIVESNDPKKLAAGANPGVANNKKQQLLLKLQQMQQDLDVLKALVEGL